MYVDEEVIERRESDQPMPFDRLEQKEATGFLLRIVGTLPLRQQEVIQLKFQNDLSYQQIAEIMQTTANNVGVLLHTARTAALSGDAPRRSPTPRNIKDIEADATAG